jgi:transcriptional regulator with XRE-family HTH domain
MHEEARVRVFPEHLRAECRELGSENRPRVLTASEHAPDRDAARLRLAAPGDPRRDPRRPPPLLAEALVQAPAEFLRARLPLPRLHFSNKNNGSETSRKGRLVEIVMSVLQRRRSYSLAALVRDWIEAQGSEGGRFSVKRAVERLGLSKSDVSRIVKRRDHAGDRFSVGKLETIAEHLGRPAWEVLREIESPKVRPDLSAMIAELRAVLETDSDPESARALLHALKRALAKGHLDLVQRILESLVELGRTPEFAMRAVLLIDPESDDGDSDTRKARRAGR